MDRQRNNGLDLLRVVSAFAVVLLHVNAIWLFSKNGASSDTEYFIENFVNLITRFCVPSFVMISGMFLLGNKNNRNMGSFYRKSFIRIGIPYAGISLAWILLLFMQHVILGSDTAYFVSLVISGTYGNLWFMPMLIGLYLLTPVLICIVEGMGQGKLLAFTVVLLIWAMISQPTSTYELPYASGVVIAFMAYFVAGYALRNVRLSKPMKIAGVVLCVVMMAVSLYLRMNGFEIYMGEYYIAFFSPTVVVFSIFVFLIFKEAKVRDMRKISGKTYYIYLLHTPVYTALYKVFENIEADPVLCIIFLTVLTFGISMIAASIYEFFCGKIISRILNKETAV